MLCWTKIFFALLLLCLVPRIRSTTFLVFQHNPAMVHTKQKKREINDLIIGTTLCCTLCVDGHMEKHGLGSRLTYHRRSEAKRVKNLEYVEHNNGYCNPE